MLWFWVMSQVSCADRSSRFVSHDDWAAKPACSMPTAKSFVPRPLSQHSWLLLRAQS
jgi:hypothetical protein